MKNIPVKMVPIMKYIKGTKYLWYQCGLFPSLSIRHLSFQVGIRNIKAQDMKTTILLKLDKSLI